MSNFMEILLFDKTIHSRDSFITNAHEEYKSLERLGRDRSIPLGWRNINVRHALFSALAGRLPQLDLVAFRVLNMDELAKMFV